MLGKIIGAAAGQRIAKNIGGIGGSEGALLGVVAATVLRRLGPAGLIAAAVGSYAIKRGLERREARGHQAGRDSR